MEIIKGAKNGVALTFVIPLTDTAASPSYKAAPTIALGDVKVARYDSAAWAVSNVALARINAITGMTTHLEIELTATEMTADDDTRPIVVTFIDQAGAEWDDNTVEIRLGAIDSNLIEIGGNDVTSGNTAELRLKNLSLQSGAEPPLSIVDTAGNDVLHLQSTGGGNVLDLDTAGAGRAVNMVSAQRCISVVSSAAEAAVFNGATIGVDIVGNNGDGLRARSLGGNGNGIAAIKHGSGKDISAEQFVDLLDNQADIYVDTQAIVAKLPSGDISDFDPLTDKVNLYDSQSTVIIGATLLASELGSQAKTDVRDQVDGGLDASIAEPVAGTPSATCSVRTGIARQYSVTRNKGTLNSSTGEKVYHNSADVAVSKKAVTDDGTTYEESGMTGV